MSRELNFHPFEVKYSTLIQVRRRHLIKTSTNTSQYYQASRYQAVNDVITLLRLVVVVVLKFRNKKLLLYFIYNFSSFLTFHSQGHVQKVGHVSDDESHDMLLQCVKCSKPVVTYYVFIRELKSRDFGTKSY